MELLTRSIDSGKRLIVVILQPTEHSKFDLGWAIPSPSLDGLASQLRVQVEVETIKWQYIFTATYRHNPYHDEVSAVRGSASVAGWKK